MQKTDVTRPGVPLEPAHQHTIHAVNDGTRRKAGSCRCGQWSAVAATSDQLADSFARHVASAQGVLL